MEISSGQLKRFIQEKLSYTWRRLRQWLKPKQEPVEYRQCYNSLQDLKKLDESGYLDLF